MATEIERKFLVKKFKTSIIDAFDMKCMGKIKIWQGYFAKGEKCSARLRISQPEVYEGQNEVSLTFKSVNPGMSREEVEFKNLNIPHLELEALKGMCECSLQKTRYIYQTYNEKSLGWNVWEIDVFHDDLDGLIIAEIEMPNEGFEFESPPWLGPEVTEIGDFYCYTLAKCGLPKQGVGMKPALEGE